VAYMVYQLQVEEFDTWKASFDVDPIGRERAARSHIIFRGVDSPDQVFIRVEFDSIKDARSFRERFVLAPGVLDWMTVLTPPTVVKIVENLTY
jgi:hypothetical protein